MGFLIFVCVICVGIIILALLFRLCLNGLKSHTKRCLGSKLETLPIKSQSDEFGVIKEEVARHDVWLRRRQVGDLFSVRRICICFTGGPEIEAIAEPYNWLFSHTSEL